MFAFKRQDYQFGLCELFWLTIAAAGWLMFLKTSGFAWWFLPTTTAALTFCFVGLRLRLMPEQACLFAITLGMLSYLTIWMADWILAPVNSDHPGFRMTDVVSTVTLFAFAAVQVCCVCFIYMMLICSWDACEWVFIPKKLLLMGLLLVGACLAMMVGSEELYGYWFGYDLMDVDWTQK